MKRDILDDYRDFLMTTRDRMQFEMHPRRAYIDKDGEVAQEMVIKCHMPGGRIVYGAAVVWYPQQIFPHGNYAEPCDTEMLFQATRSANELDIRPGDTINSGPDGDVWVEHWDPAKLPPDPFPDDADLEWLNGYDF